MVVNQHNKPVIKGFGIFEGDISPHSTSEIITDKQ